MSRKFYISLLVIAILAIALIGPVWYSTKNTGGIFLPTILADGGKPTPDQQDQAQDAWTFLDPLCDNEMVIFVPHDRERLIIHEEFGGQGWLTEEFELDRPAVGLLQPATILGPGGESLLLISIVYKDEAGRLEVVESTTDPANLFGRGD